MKYSHGDWLICFLIRFNKRKVNQCAKINKVSSIELRIRYKITTTCFSDIRKKNSHRKKDMNIVSLDRYLSIRQVENQQVNYLNLHRCLRQNYTIESISNPESVAGISVAGNYLIQMPKFASDYTNLIELNGSHNELNTIEWILYRTEASENDKPKVNTRNLFSVKQSLFCLVIASADTSISSNHQFIFQSYQNCANEYSLSSFSTHIRSFS